VGEETRPLRLEIEAVDAEDLASAENATMLVTGAKTTILALAEVIVLVTEGTVVSATSYSDGEPTDITSAFVAEPQMIDPLDAGDGPVSG
jgi:hypothetical protein